MAQRSFFSRTDRPRIPTDSSHQPDTAPAMVPGASEDRNRRHQQRLRKGFERNQRQPALLFTAWNTDNPGNGIERRQFRPRRYQLGDAWSSY